MGVASWYDGFVRHALRYPGVPPIAIKKDFDLFRKHGYAGYLFRVEREKGSQLREVRLSGSYVDYLMRSVGRTFDNTLLDFCKSTVDLLT